MVFPHDRILVGTKSNGRTKRENWKLQVWDDTNEQKDFMQSFRQILGQNYLL